MQNRIVNVSSYRNYQKLDQINRRALREPAAFAEECECAVDALLEKTAEYILYSGSRIVMLAGPSGSGKTTVSRRLAEVLAKKGCQAHSVEMDNYFVTLDRADHSIDWEAPDRLDRSLIVSHIEALSRGEEVLLPRFDFSTGIQHPAQTPLRLGRGEIAVFEGIHALNNGIMDAISEKTVPVYISARLRVRDETHVIFHPEWMRFLRRGLRDEKFRNTALSETLLRWGDVKRGEKTYIIPSKRRAAIMLDTALDYEMNVLAPLLLEDVKAQDAELLSRVRMTRIAEAMERFTPISPDLVPERSILREFLGK